MSLSQGTRAHNRSSRDDHRTLCCTFPEQAESALLKQAPQESEERGRSSKKNMQPGARAVTARGVVTAPRVWSLCLLTCHLHPFPISAAKQATGFPLWKFCLSSLRSATSCPHVARLNSSSDTSAVLQTPPKVSDFRKMESQHRMPKIALVCRVCRPEAALHSLLPWWLQEMFEAWQEPSHCSSIASCTGTR